MTKRILLSIVCVWCVGLLRAQSDTVLMRIGPMSVSRAEFIHAYHKHGAGEPLHHFLARFVGLKRQVCEAQAEGLDTTAAFRQRYDACRQEWETRLNASSLQSGQQEGATEIQPEGEWVAHVCIRVPQDVSFSRMDRMRATLDSLARATSSCGLSEWIQAYGDSLPEGWQAEVACVVPSQLPNDLLLPLRKLHPGEMSAPLLSPVGLHLIQRLDSGVENGRQKNEPEEPEAPSFILQEYHDGLLSGMLEDKMFQTDERALKKYYKKHKKHYRWQLPHFKGIVLQANDKEKLGRLVKYLKGFSEEEWPEAVARFDSIGGSQWVKMEYGLYQIGTNDCIDKYYFGQGDFTPSAEYPHVCVLGKVLKRKPESYKDVYVRLVQDYRDTVWKEAQKKWAKKFGVEINEEALKTVNNHDAI